MVVITTPGVVQDFFKLVVGYCQAMHWEVFTGPVIN